MSDSVNEVFKQVPMAIKCIENEETMLPRIANSEDRQMLHLRDDLQVRSERLEIYDSLATREFDSNGDIASVIPSIQALLTDLDSNRS